MPDWSPAQISGFFEIEENKVLQLKAALTNPDTVKMEKNIRQLFFKDIQLHGKEWEKVLDLADAYRKGVRGFGK